MRKLRKKFVLLLIVAFLALLAWDNTRIVTEEFSYADAALPENFDGFRIAQLSDLHGRSFGGRLAKAVAAARPDLIVLTGDFADAHTVVASLEDTVRAIAAVAPTYFVTGNHEWGAHKTKETLSYFREWGVACLENQYVSIEREGEEIFLAGIHDPNGYADQKTPGELARELYAAEGEPYWLLLAHRSNLFPSQYAPLGANLTLSGHAHGGIWRLPLTDGLFGTQGDLFPTLTDGFYTYEGETVFVSRGLGNSPRYLPRIGNPPQIALITLTKEAVQ